MSAESTECNVTPQPQASTNTQGTHLPCSFYGCKQTFSNMHTLSSHIESHQIPALSLPGKAFHCSSIGCNGTFPSMQHLMEHMRHHYKPNHYFLCESCRAKLRSYRALFKHLHTCAKVAKSKAAKEEMTSPAIMSATEAYESTLAYDSMAPVDTQTPMKEEPMELEPASTITDSSPTNPVPPLTSLQAAVDSLPKEAPLALPASPSSALAQASPPALSPLSPGLFSPTATSVFPVETVQSGGAFPSSTIPSPPPASSSPPIPGQRPSRPVAPVSPAPSTPPGSNAVWKKNQDAPRPLMLRRNSHPSSQSISAGEIQGSLSAAASSGSTPEGDTAACRARLGGHQSIRITGVPLLSEQRSHWTQRQRSIPNSN
ncbi:hypothetical protein GJAV_G00114840 [Gymnothorax javanicus]|nr:hypothetical protein GJAV_G00114840 [Gymnothorax javanicus]